MDSKVFHKITYGLYLLTASQDGKENGCIINTAVQVANEPLRISIAVIKKNKTHDMIMATGRFNLSAITESAPFTLFQRFGMQSGRDTDKFSGFSSVAHSENGLPYLTEKSNMYLSARVLHSVDLGSHTLFIAEPTDGAVLSQEPSCSYSYYQSSIKPKAAPKSGKTRWVCSVCGYVYEGEELPDDFIGPLCKHGKEDFVKEE